ncbi:cuticle protein 16.8-like [Limulus polyphemus]|uniref:Cuticle protein 16.8-like n=1 Tax=Limulus polyphemus TaxID=6850 RepID=A0ABM1BIN6_LIMPO|nr:cuticle protein 16.8-like [Limulus polyphemus]
MVQAVIFVVVLVTVSAGVPFPSDDPAAPPYDHPLPVYAPEPPHELEVPEPYNFGYETTDEFGNLQSRHEEADGTGVVRGSYGYTDVYGIYRQVEYVADADGYRAVVKTNEPGTANANPANVEVFAEEALIPNPEAPAAVPQPISPAPVPVSYPVVPAPIPSYQHPVSLLHQAYSYKPVLYSHPAPYAPEVKVPAPRYVPSYPATITTDASKEEKQSE